MPVPGKLCAACIVLFSSFSPLFAQPALRDASISATQFSQLARDAGFIFSGTVLSVARDPALSGHAASVRTTFKVDRGIRGVRTGEILAIREWAGPWEAGERYRPGEHVFLFLYPPSKLGLTSPVGGQAGRFPVDSGSVLVGPSEFLPVSRPAAPGVKRERGVSQREFIRQIRRAMEEDHGTR
jgi:hypothetical protein